MALYDTPPPIDTTTGRIPPYRQVMEQEQTHRALEVATSEQEMFRSQGKAILLGQLIKLKDDINKIKKE